VDFRALLPHRQLREDAFQHLTFVVDEVFPYLAVVHGEIGILVVRSGNRVIACGLFLAGPDVMPLRLEGRKLLHSYARGRGVFEGFDFVSWIRRFVFEYGTDIVVRTAGADDDFKGIDGRVSAEYDAALCEGMYVMANGKMYDYSIRNKEING
jgi:hypothetical protein